MPLTSQIVQVNATVAGSPTASTLQQAGALVSVGGTTATTNSYTFYANLAAVTAALSTLGNYTEVTAMATTYFAQQSATAPTLGVYIVELGVVANSAAGVAALTTWIAANPGIIYAYLIPATWDSTSSTAVNTLAGLYSSATGATYFFVTATAGNIANYTNKACVCFVKSSGAAGTEFGAAALFYNFIANNPSVASPAAPMAFRFVFGVTPWTITGNTTTIGTLLTAFANIVITGAEGGISTAMLTKGTAMDGNQLMYWYAIDWLVLQARQRLAAAIINGSNSNPPLYYNQFGINTLLGILDDMGTAGIGFGLLLEANFTATPFATYTTANPTTYASGIYNGFSCTATPQTGFEQITFNLSAVTFL